jgi:hypothetical protein
MNRFTLLLSFCTYCAFSFAQVGISETSITPESSSILDLESTSKGMLVPRMTAAQKNAITSPAQGLLVYQTNIDTGFWYYEGSVWKQLLSEYVTVSDSAWGLEGNSGTNTTNNFIGTRDNNGLVFKTNNTENMRISTNGNVGIGTTGSSNSRLYAYITSADSTTNISLRTNNYGTTNNTKYGFYNYVNNAGTGGRAGINNNVYQNSSSNSVSYGIRNAVYTYGTSAQYGLYNYLSGSGTGIHYGQRNYLYLANTLKNNAYGEYTYVDISDGARYGEYKFMTSSATYGHEIYGDYNQIVGSGNDSAYGTYNEISLSGSGIKHGTYNEMNSGASSGTQYAIYNAMSGNGTGTKYGSYTRFSAGTGTKYGTMNVFDDIAGTKYGTFNQFANGTATGTIYGTYNQIYNDANATKYGTFNYIAGGEGALRGSYNAVYPATTNTSTIYGVYSYVSSSGTGLHYGGYFNAYGDGNRAVYGTNTHATGYAGYFTGNGYWDGDIIFNESGTVDHDFRVETDTRTHGFFIDAGNDVVRTGSSAGALTSNGTTIASTVVDYVADFDKGASTGTAIGIGSIEFLLDGTATTHINNAFSPTTYITLDLGANTTTTWDDVYADNYVNVSDIRAKKDIQNLNYGLDEVLAMRPVSYILKDDPFQETKLGLIAQEALKLVPESVKTHNHVQLDESKPQNYTKVEMERMGMTYNALIPVLIKAIQEQQTQIDELKLKLEQVEQQGE